MTASALYINYGDIRLPSIPMTSSLPRQLGEGTPKAVAGPVRAIKQVS